MPGDVLAIDSLVQRSQHSVGLSGGDQSGERGGRSEKRGRAVLSCQDGGIEQLVVTGAPVIRNIAGLVQHSVGQNILQENVPRDRGPRLSSTDGPTDMIQQVQKERTGLSEKQI